MAFVETENTRSKKTASLFEAISKQDEPEVTCSNQNITSSPLVRLYVRQKHPLS